MRRLWAVPLFLLAGACADRTHLSSTFGQATTLAFRAQVINPDAGMTQQPDPGLDPEEAAEVVETYRRSISSKKGGHAADAPQVLVIEQSPSGRPAPPRESK